MQGLFIRAMFIEDTVNNKENFENYSTMLDKHVAEMMEKSDSAQMDVFAKDLNTYNDAFNEAADQAINLHDAGRLDEALQIVNGGAQLANKGLLEVSDEIVAYQKKPN